jgi:hypothetical protein
MYSYEEKMVNYEEQHSEVLRPRMYTHKVGQQNKQVGRKAISASAAAACYRQQNSPFLNNLMCNTEMLYCKDIFFAKSGYDARKCGVIKRNFGGNCRPQKTDAINLL